MKKYLIGLLALTLAFSFIVACGGGEKTAKKADSGAFEEMNDPFQSLTDQANQIIEAGGVAAVGQGISGRMDLAKKKAVLDAQGQLASILKTKVSKLNKSFQEEIGSANDSEINEAFTNVVKAVSKATLRGAITKKVKYLRDKETKNITAGVVVAIEPNKINMSIFDELKKKPKLYERFRASQAYKELDNEMKNWDKQENSGN